MNIPNNNGQLMVQSLERTITPDMSEVEKQRIYEQIRMIRERKD